MRYEPDHKQRTRERVVKAAAKAIRARGPDRVGVAEVMAKAGLTHGGFYAHFKSKDDLIAAAIDRMFDELLANTSRRFAGKGPGPALTAFIDFYLSPAHRDSVALGCPIPPLGPELLRLVGPARARFVAGVARTRGLISDRLEGVGHQNASEEAYFVLAELIGVLSLVRAEPDMTRSDRILEIARRRLICRLGLQKPACA